ncbi:glutamine synthetase family protein [Streptomyces pinistramenti]|uniref:glutamine synthetase family protein n=1 Tax=Streptomyces pinistramenti TaxID=2884812 RepID=UPI001D08781F|nr:glutamine synthetase family protein [Streptomyces pinistramenti]MCB5911927.1 glutamine synthetase family protein [Streptomyces pinistramenti]
MASRPAEQRVEARQLAAHLDAEGVRNIAVTWIDNAGIARVKAVPTARIGNAAERGIGMSPVFDVFTSDDAITESPHLGGPDGDLRLFPVLDRVTALAAQPGWAWAPADRYDQLGTPHPACQRDFARRMAARAAAAGIGLRMGFETEWVVARTPEGGGPHPTDPHTPLDYPCAGPAYGMTRIVELSDYLRDITEALTVQGIEVLQLHPEYSPGQFEVSTAAADPVRAADDVVLVRETLRAVSARHGLRASFAPSVVAGQVGNGCHLHLSLHRDGHSLHRTPDAALGLAPDAAAFLGGILAALPALLAIGCPSPASYLRLQPSQWAGVYQCWGVENREAALRLITGAPDDPDGGNAEIKTFDAAANPYLAVGAVIAAGLHGIETGTPLPDPVSGDPGALGVRERSRRGIVRLPATLTDATDHLEKSAALRDAMGEVLHGAVLAVRRAEEAQFAGSEADEIAAATRWRW